MTARILALLRFKTACGGNPRAEIRNPIEARNPKSEKQPSVGLCELP